MGSNFKTLKSDTSALTSKVEDITYAWSKSVTDDCGLLGNMLGVDKYYTHQHLHLHNPRGTHVIQPIHQQRDAHTQM
jgi:hypothetical protein